MKIGECPKCKEIKPLTRHHIKPRRFFSSNNKNILLICRDCHNNLEFFIPQQQKMCDSFYFKIVELFLAQ